MSTAVIFTVIEKIAFLNRLLHIPKNAYLLSNILSPYNKFDFFLLAI